MPVNWNTKCHSSLTHLCRFLSYLWIKKKLCNSESLHPHKEPRRVVTSVSISLSESKCVLEGNMCGTAWTYAFACKQTMCEQICVGASICVREGYINFSLHNWICMTLTWIWVRTLGLVFSMLTMCGLNAELGCNPKWTELVCFAVYSPFFFRLKRRKIRVVYSLCFSLLLFHTECPPPLFSFSSLFPSLVLFHTCTLLHKVTFLSIISLFPCSFSPLPLMCLFSSHP